MGKLETIAVLSLIEAISKIGETFFDGDRKDDLTDVLDALKGIFGIGDCEHDKEEGEEG